MEKVIHSIGGSLHILAVITWIGSMIYNQFGVAPALRTSVGTTKTHAISGLIMKNFNPLTWTSILVLILTGLYGIFDNKDKFTSITDGPGAVLTIKLLLVTVLIIIFLLQVFLYGPRMKQLLMPSTPKNVENGLAMTQVEQTTKWMSWWHLGIGITIVIFGVILSKVLE